MPDQVLVPARTTPGVTVPVHTYASTLGRRDINMKRGLTETSAFAFIPGLAELFGAMVVVAIAIAPALAQQADSVAARLSGCGSRNRVNFSTVLENIRANEFRKNPEEAEGRLLWTPDGTPDDLVSTCDLEAGAQVYIEQHKYSRAERLFKRVLVIKENTLGARHPDVHSSLNDLVIVYKLQGKYGDAEDLYKRELAITEKAVGVSHRDVATSLDNLANLYRSQGKYSAAEPLYKRALVIREKSVGMVHPDTAQSLHDLASLYRDAGKLEIALSYFRKASAVVLAHAGTNPDSRQPNTKQERREHYFIDHVSILHTAAAKGIGPRADLAREALEIAQNANSSSTAVALQQMAVRLAATTGRLADLLRERQDLAALWRERDKALIAALSEQEDRREDAANPYLAKYSPPKLRNAEALVNAIRKQLTDSESRFATITSQLERQFPEYATLENPKPLKAAEIQELLGDEEALLFFLTADTDSYVFALTRDRFEWETVALGREALAEKVAAFRRGLNVDALH